MDQCFHTFKAKTRNYAVCNNCNTILSIHNCKITPIQRLNNTFQDINPFDILRNMREDNLGPLDSDRYISVRKQLIEFLKSLCKRYHLKRYTQHLAVYLLDKLSLNNELMKECNLELLTIGCFILSGINFIN